MIIPGIGGLLGLGVGKSMLTSLSVGGEYWYKTFTYTNAATGWACRLSDTTFALTYYNSEDRYFYSKVGTISNATEITWGTEIRCPNIDSVPNSMVAMSSTKFCVSYSRALNKNSQMMIYYVNGATITGGYDYYLCGGQSNMTQGWAKISRMDSSKVAVVFLDTSFNYDDIKIKVVNVDNYSEGTTITISTNPNIHSIYHDVCGLSSGAFILRTEGIARVCTVSGNTINAEGTNIALDYQGVFHMISASEVIFSSHSAVRKITISGTTLILQTNFTLSFTGTNGYLFHSAMLNPATQVIASPDIYDTVYACIVNWDGNIPSQNAWFLVSNRSGIGYPNLCGINENTLVCSTSNYQSGAFGGFVKVLIAS